MDWRIPAFLVLLLVAAPDVHARPLEVPFVGGVHLRCEVVGDVCKIGCDALQIAGRISEAFDILIECLS